ncbi:uncharacterized protein LOC110441691 [Mizuhopecten yessoensis]|uniref:uncharacterized protein LOC110441691 n=1 Tax=Mizuhopecten yessoensis TaxID=6573 RepID=UPI000B45AE81|nr:uncharacterized protein LOC110441691 [Mizuhopecten yessoensis]
MLFQKCIVVICIQVFIVQIVLSPVSYGKSAPSNGTEEDEGPRNSSTNPGRKSTVGKALADLIKAIFRLIRVEIKSTEDLVPDFEADPNRDPMSLPFITIENVNGTMVATSRDVNIYHAIKEQQRRHNNSQEAHYVSDQQDGGISVAGADLSKEGVDSGENEL